ncbi:MAG: hypothetical protein FD161_4925, partial [Limisphaerales bacterium]
VFLMAELQTKRASLERLRKMVSFR